MFTYFSLSYFTHPSYSFNSKVRLENCVAPQTCTMGRRTITSHTVMGALVQSMTMQGHSIPEVTATSQFLCDPKMGSKRSHQISTQSLLSNLSPKIICTGSCLTRSKVIRMFTPHPKKKAQL